MKLRWPRGRYNGQRIVGFSIKIRVRLDYWGFNLRPRDFRNAWLMGSAIGVGPLLVHFVAEANS